MGNYSTFGVLYASFHFFILSSIRYWLYKDNLRIPAKKMYFILTVILIGSGITWVITGGIPNVSFAVVRMLTSVLMFALSCWIIKEPLSKHAFSYAFILAYDAAMETTANFFQYTFGAAETDYIYIIVLFGLMSLTIYPATRALKKMITRLSELENDKVWSYLTLCSFSFLIVNLLFALPKAKAMSIIYPISRYMMLFAMFCMYAAAVRIMDTMKKTVEAKANLEISQRRIALQESYYDRLVSQMDEVRKMRHDLRHHRTVLSALVKAEDIAAVSAYIEQISIDDSSIPVTGNLAFDSVLLFYLDAAKKMEVTVESDLVIGEALPISAPDLCVILGNLLENAVEAQQYLPKEKRLVRISARGDESSLVLAIDNRFDGTLNSSAGDFVSRKEGDNHGMGISSISSVCKKYDGVYNIDVDGDMFMSGLVIQRKEK